MNGRLSRALALLLLAVPLCVASACSTETGAGSQEVAAVRVVDPGEAGALIEEGATVIDVRTPEEFATGHVAGALNIDVQAADFHQRVGELERHKSYVVYCRSGSRAGAAADVMLQMGFTDVANGGGLAELEQAGVPVG